MAIARAVAGERRLLLADEPSGALDSVNAEAVMRLIHEACKRGVAAVVVTHDASWPRGPTGLVAASPCSRSSAAHPDDARRPARRTTPRLVDRANRVLVGAAGALAGAVLGVPTCTRWSKGTAVAWWS